MSDTTVALFRDISSFLFAFGGIVSVLAVMRYRVQRNDEDEKHLRAKVEAISADLSRMLVEIKVFSSQQSVINKVTADTLSSLTRKVEGIEKILSERNELGEAIVRLSRKIDELK